MDILAVTEALGYGIGGGIILALGQKIKRLRNGNGGHKAGISGEKPVEFWQLEFRQAIADVMVPLIERQQDTLDKIEETNDHMKDILVAIKAILSKTI